MIFLVVDQGLSMRQRLKTFSCGRIREALYCPAIFERGGRAVGGFSSILGDLDQSAAAARRDAAGRPQLQAERTGHYQPGSSPGRPSGSSCPRARVQRASRRFLALGKRGCCGDAVRHQAAGTALAAVLSIEQFFAWRR